jgi:hypothetical protein
LYDPLKEMEMSLMAAVDLAITLQLVADDKTDYPNYKRIMGPSVAAVGGAAAIEGYGYDVTTIMVFLQMVAMRLNSDTPALTFDWVSINTQSYLDANRATLIGLIARNTKASGGK